MKKFFYTFFILVILFYIMRPIGDDFRHHLSHIKKGAERGDTADQASLGDYYFGNKEYKEALKYYHKAAEKRQTHAEFQLGVMYARGLGVSQDWKTAYEWWHKAANGGHPDAQINMGLVSREGIYVSRDMGESFRWFREAADKWFNYEEFYKKEEE